MKRAFRGGEGVRGRRGGDGGLGVEVLGWKVTGGGGAKIGAGLLAMVVGGGGVVCVAVVVVGVGRQDAVGFGRIGRSETGLTSVLVRGRAGFGTWYFGMATGFVTSSWKPMDMRTRVRV